jgi:hypothetical protein
VYNYVTSLARTKQTVKLKPKLRKKDITSVASIIDEVVEQDVSCAIRSPCRQSLRHRALKWRKDNVERQFPKCTLTIEWRGRGRNVRDERGAVTRQRVSRGIPSVVEEGVQVPDRNATSAKAKTSHLVCDNADHSKWDKVEAGKEESLCALGVRREQLRILVPKLEVLTASGKWVIP